MMSLTAKRFYSDVNFRLIFKSLCPTETLVSKTIEHRSNESEREHKVLTVKIIFTGLPGHRWSPSLVSQVAIVGSALSPGTKCKDLGHGMHACALAVILIHSVFVTGHYRALGVGLVTTSPQDHTANERSPSSAGDSPTHKRKQWSQLRHQLSKGTTASEKRRLRSVFFSLCLKAGSVCITFSRRTSLGTI